MDPRKSVLALMLIASCASAESEFYSLGYVAAVFGVLSLIFTYRLIYANNGLDAQIVKKTAQLRKLKEEVQRYESEVRHHRQDASKNLDTRINSEIERAKEVAEGKRKFDGLDKNYWQRMGEMSQAPDGAQDVKKLIEEKSQVERMIALTKAKYLEMDKKSFDNIMEGYQRKLIELEAKIAAEGAGKGGG